MNFVAWASTTEKRSDDFSSSSSFVNCIFDLHWSRPTFYLQRQRRLTSDESCFCCCSSPSSCCGLKAFIYLCLVHKCCYYRALTKKGLRTKTVFLNQFCSDKRPTRFNEQNLAAKWVAILVGSTVIELWVDWWTICHSGLPTFAAG